MSAASPIRFLFALPGFHQEERGAEVALLAVAEELAQGGDPVMVMGAGEARPDTSYAYRKVTAVNRKHFERVPHFPPFRSETAWEDATFGFNLWRAYDPASYDITLTCNFPFTHWVLRNAGRRHHRPKHLFVTQNGDWPAWSDDSEFRTFACDGLVCTNPDFEDRNRDKWSTALIPNGIYPERFGAADAEPSEFGLPTDRPIVLMVSALIETKRVLDGILAVAAIDGPSADKLPRLVVAGDGPLRQEVDRLAAEYLPGRFSRITVPAAAMPRLYRCASVFLHMSLLESFGNVFVEAMASGLPIVGHDTPRLRWIIGDCPTLCDTADRDAVRDALVKALQIGRGAADPRSQEFAWPQIAARYRAFAARILDSGIKA